MAEKLTSETLAEWRFLCKSWLDAITEEPPEFKTEDFVALLDHCTALEEELKAAYGLANVKNELWESAEKECDELRAERDSECSKQPAPSVSECVEEVKRLRDEWLREVNARWDERPDLSFEAADKIEAANEIISALESLQSKPVASESRLRKVVNAHILDLRRCEAILKLSPYADALAPTILEIGKAIDELIIAAATPAPEEKK